jgi:hypothetical protein
MGHGIEVILGPLLGDDLSIVGRLAMNSRTTAGKW